MKTFRCPFIQVYGLTETTGAITELGAADHDPDGPRAHLLRSAGKPYPWVELRIVDPETGRDRAAGEVGELWTRSVQNMKGYWNKPEETARTHHGATAGSRPATPGFMDADGYLFLTDRVKDMIVSGGENIYPAEVENALLGPSGHRRRGGDRRARTTMGRDGQGHRGAPGRRRPARRGDHRRTRGSGSRTTSAPRRSTSRTRCRAIRRASS